jgi:spermidine synthase
MISRTIQLRRSGAAALLAVAACAPSTTPSAAPETSRVATPAGVAPALSPGVLAEVRGAYGIVRVEERDGLRMLTIDGAVQGARRIGGDAVAVPGDPMVDLVLGAAPNAKTALIVGLGTGKTASELAARGLAVRVVERDQAVVELAKKWFDWRGETVVADAADELYATKEKYDVVVVDAELRVGKTGSAFDRATLQTARRVLTGDGVLAVRFTGAPARAAEVAPALGEHHIAYGRGIGDEEQTLFAIGSDQPLDLVLPSGIDVARIADSGRGATTDPALFTQARGSQRERRVSIIGYLVRLTEDGALAVDLPHAEMGALRFRLGGALAAELAKRLPSDATFPTQGDIVSDGDTKRTLAPLLGGGGFKRSDLRFSPVVVSIEGVARLRSDVSPNHAFSGHVLSDSGPTEAPVREKLLPYGGTLYELDVDRVAWSLDAARFGEMKKTASVRAADAAELVRLGKLADAATAIEKTEDSLRAIGPDADARIPSLRRLHLLGDRLKIESARHASATSALARGAACDRARGAEPSREWLFPAPVDALYECAVREYKAAFAKEQTSENAKLAIARLLALYDESFSNARFDRREALQKRFPTIEPLETAPP